MANEEKGRTHNTPTQMGMCAVFNAEPLEKVLTDKAFNSQWMGEFKKYYKLPATEVNTCLRSLWVRGCRFILM